MNDVLKKLLSNKYAVYAVCAVCGILLIILSGAFKSKPKSSTEPAFNEKEYLNELESRMSDMLSSIKGAGRCHVMINIASTTESVYVKETKRSSSNANDNVKSETEDSVLKMKDGSGSEYALVKKQIMPKISGVSVVCDGGGSADVKANVISAVCTVLGISSNKVCVIAKAN